MKVYTEIELPKDCYACPCSSIRHTSDEECYLHCNIMGSAVDHYSGRDPDCCLKHTKKEDCESCALLKHPPHTDVNYCYECGKNSNKYKSPFYHVAAFI